jgi:hypothetical protein
MGGENFNTARSTKNLVGSTSQPPRIPKSTSRVYGWIEFVSFGLLLGLVGTGNSHQERERKQSGTGIIIGRKIPEIGEIFSSGNGKIGKNF